MLDTIPRNGSSLFYGSHVLGDSVIRIHDDKRTGDELYDKVFCDTPLQTNCTVETIKKHIRSLLNSLPRKLSALVLINTGLFNYELVNAAASAVTTDTIVKIVPSLMARFLYTTNNIQPPIKEGQHVLIFTKIADIADFHVLRRENSIYEFIFEWQGYPVNIPSLFKKYASKYIENGGIAVILYDDVNKALTEEIAKKFSHINIIQTHCPNWNEMLLHGGLNKASTVMSKNIKIAYDVKDFTIGFQLINNDQGSCNAEKTVLMKVGTTIPKKFHEEMTLEKIVKVLSNPTTALLSKSTFKRERIVHYSGYHDKGLYSVQIEVDKNGFVKIDVNRKDGSDDIHQNAEINNIQRISLSGEQAAGSSTNLSYSGAITYSSPSSSYRQHEKSNSFDKDKPTSGNHYQRSSTQISSPLQQINSTFSSLNAEQQSLILPIHSDFMICLNERHCCICLPTVGNVTKRIPDINGNIWIPMYVSFLNCPPILGEAAKRDMNINPECVVYDILDVLFLPYSEIQIKPEWAFNIAYTGENEKQTVLEIQTWKGIHAVAPVSVLALIFVGLHKEAERVSGKKLKNVFIKTTMNAGRIDENVIRNAVKIGRLECTGVEAMPVLNVQ